MFPSVRERAQAFLNGGQAPVVTPPPPPPATPSKLKSATKTAPEKPAATPSKSTPPKPTPSKPTPSKAPAAKPAPNKAAAPPPSTPSKAAPSKSIFSKATPVKEKTPPKASSKPSTSKTSSSKPTPSKPAPSKSTPSKPTPSRTKSTPAKSTSLKIAPPKFLRSKSSISTSSSGSDDDMPELSPGDQQVVDLRAAILKQASSVTGLQGRSLALNLKKTSSDEWYAALKDTGSDKYLKMWMNRKDTYDTQIEALEAYLRFMTKRKESMQLFPMSPKTGSKTK
ncbi:hypothetical protein NX059_000066 [Plenodomus lindquistii]|nr:hypothetical protein NX059_000066 [Plenodomus lindquistii]